MARHVGRESLSGPGKPLHGREWVSSLSGYTRGMEMSKITKENRDMLRGEFEYLFPPQKDYGYNSESDSYFAPDCAPSRRFYAQERYNAQWQKYQSMRFNNINPKPIRAERFSE